MVYNKDIVKEIKGEQKMKYYCAIYTDKYDKKIQKLYVKNKRSFRNLKKL